MTTSEIRELSKLREVLRMIFWDITEGHIRVESDPGNFYFHNACHLETVVKHAIMEATDALGPEAM